MIGKIIENCENYEKLRNEENAEEIETRRKLQKNGK